MRMSAFIMTGSIHSARVAGWGPGRDLDPRWKEVDPGTAGTRYAFMVFTI
jgi:hypothetical protein